MDDNAPQETPSAGFNKLDLSQLQGFSFGTQWTQDKSSGGRQERPRPEGEGRGRGDGPGADRRDRRSFRRPAGDAPHGGDPASDNRGPRRDARPGGDRSGPGDQRGGPRRGGPMGDRRMDPRGERQPDPRIPYDSPYFHATFYPEDSSFTTLAKTVRTSCRTFELFDIARTVIGKPDRFVVVLHRKPPGGMAPAADAAPAKLPPIAISVPDGIPFESEEAAIAHVLSRHLGTFFDVSDVQVDPPKGNFQVVNKCGVTGELLAPPNYHRYAQIIQQHHAAKLGRMPFETFKSRIETVRDPEVIAQWLEKMKKATRYTWKSGRSAPKPAAADAATATPATESANTPAAPAPTAETPAAEAPAADAPAAEATPAPEPAAAPSPEAKPELAFDTFEEARSHLLANARDRMVRLVDSARFQGKLLESIPPGEIRRAAEGTLDRQRRFPLDTANALRGRLRREGFTIFKKGAKGISYVCAVKRRFRVPGQVFSESITNLINFIEAHPMVKAGELPEKLLQIALPAAPAADAAPADGAAAPAPEPLTSAQREQLARLQGDLRWLVHEGYVTEFIDGGLYAAPPVVEARKREIESAEHDPENFPDAPAAAPESSPEPAPDAAAGSSAPGETPAPAEGMDPAAPAQSKERAPTPEPSHPPLPVE